MGSVLKQIDKVPEHYLNATWIVHIHLHSGGDAFTPPAEKFLREQGRLTVHTHPTCQWQTGKLSLAVRGWSEARALAHLLLIFLNNKGLRGSMIRCGVEGVGLVVDVYIDNNGNIREEVAYRIRSEELMYGGHDMSQEMREWTEWRRNNADF